MRLAFGDRGILVVDVDGKSSQRLTDPPAGYRDGSPSWSPDGKRIAFERDHVSSNSFATDGSLYIAGADGRGLKLREPGGLDPSWSPSGKDILFVVTTGHDNFWDVAKVDGSSRPAELPMMTVDATWSPDGRQIALGTANGVYLVNADGSSRRKISSGHAGSVAWSPDGHHIAFGTMSAVGLSTGIAVVGVDGSGRRLLARGETGAPEWSPDGTRLAFLESHSKGIDVEVINADGSGRRTLARNLPLLLDPPAWSPDGKWIAFTTAAPDSYGIYLVKPDGTDLHRLRKIPSGGVLGMDWQPCTA